MFGCGLRTAGPIWFAFTVKLCIDLEKVINTFYTLNFLIEINIKSG